MPWFKDQHSPPGIPFHAKHRTEALFSPVLPDPPVVSEIPVVTRLPVSELPDVPEPPDVPVQLSPLVELEPIVAGSFPEPVPVDELVGRVLAVVSAFAVVGVVAAVSDDVLPSLSHPI